MEASSKIENSTADKTDPSPQLSLDSVTKSERDDKPMIMIRLATIEKKDAQNPVSESWECTKNDEVEEEPMSRAGRGERRRLKQRERRQNWRRNKQEKKAEVAKESLLEMQGQLDLLLSPPKAPPTDIDCTAAATQAKRHRLGSEECTLDFFRLLFETDTRPTDWDLVAEDDLEISHLYSKFTTTTQWIAAATQELRKGKKFHSLIKALASDGAGVANLTLGFVE
ncbi:hypothetical protein NUW58_g881 [Xylaria curta]|uniref:Uncharacterized protein n=1 Tax=Xylaria curta TaxID=42375 RepID=A0ACC1PNR4_9PEZI|nr:hypothetical protein NUW58_g881 [Xylaria curta]